ncbi:MAG: S41 family peptidase [Bacteroides sp.]|nr:S41 family peptidase [Bacteroides sp.]MCM1095653.1 S41 family peptidase [Terasakiella sp.]
MKSLRILIAPVLLAAATASCHHIDEWDDDAAGNFDALWSIIDRHYCFLDEKGVDWDSVYSAYRPRVDSVRGPVELFDLCSDMLAELRDGHVNLTSPFATSYYKKWWSDYPQNYDARLVEEYYLHFGGYSRGGFDYAVLPDSIAYVRYASFSVPASDTTLDWMLMLLRRCRGMVLDIRDNGGGSMTSVETIVRRFIDRRICAGYISHKSGPGRDDFSEPYAYYYDPAPAGSPVWERPVVLLVNRSTFSAANNFASIMSQLPRVTLVGDTTGGGCGMPFGSEIPCGWAVRFSASPVYDAELRLTEFGVAPDHHVDLDPAAALTGHDTILDYALALLASTPAD